MLLLLLENMSTFCQIYENNADVWKLNLNKTKNEKNVKIE